MLWRAPSRHRGVTELEVTFLTMIFGIVFGAVCGCAFGLVHYLEAIADPTRVEWRMAVPLGAYQRVSLERAGDCRWASHSSSRRLGSSLASC